MSQYNSSLVLKHHQNRDRNLTKTKIHKKGKAKLVCSVEMQFQRVSSGWRWGVATRASVDISLHAVCWLLHVLRRMPQSSLHQIRQRRHVELQKREKIKSERGVWGEKSKVCQWCNTSGRIQTPEADLGSCFKLLDFDSLYRYTEGFESLNT